MARRRQASDDDSTHEFLLRLFWRASTPLVSSLLLSACATDEGAEIAERASALGESSLHCAQQRWRPMSALKLAEPVDFVALRTRGRRSISEIDAAGMPCARAHAPRVCEAELRRVSAQASSPHIVFTRGDTVRALETLEEKLSLLGAIDTPDEALLVLQHDGVFASCGSGAAGELTQVREREGGYRVVTHTSGGCSGVFNRRFTDVDATGASRLVSESSVSTVNSCPPPPPAVTTGGTAGRRPPNLLAARQLRAPTRSLGRYFARMAWLEAASVAAFEQLAAELRVLGAPRALRGAALRAAEDEVRHARETAALAEHHGARPELPRLSRSRLRGRAEVALDNALEGCVHETYAAYLATAQARLSRAQGPFRAIAADETRHAALAWQIADWIEPQLAPALQRYIRARRERALYALAT